MDIAHRLQRLREEMSREGLSAYIVTSSDPHNSEYTPDRWRGREWVSGFDGSAGTAVITMHSAALWTDSRYFLAAERQLKGSEFRLMKLKIAGTPTVAEWLGSELACDTRREVGISGLCLTAEQGKQLIDELRLQGGITLRTNIDLLDRVWDDRPTLPPSPVSIQPMQCAGESVADKLRRVRQALRDQHADGMLVSALDDIAWTLNLRGNDVHCTPVFVAYLLIESRRATLYVEPGKLTDDVRSHLSEAGVDVAPYADINQAFNRYGEYNILLDPGEVSYSLWQLAMQKRPDGSRVNIVSGTSPVAQMKTVKNSVEQQGYHNAMLRDGVALVRFLIWLERQTKAAVLRGDDVIRLTESLPRHAAGEPLTEMAVDEKLTMLRAEQDLYRGLSFDTIAGYGPHGAVVHYEATPSTDTPLRTRSLLLLDSGAQYQDGTTDVTRTISLGPTTEEERRIYTLVLKGHLRLQNVVFPDGASGTQLDAIAREPLWRQGLNFLHGTGHGVGSYLSVHEGRHQVRMEWHPQPLRAGMTLTDEPGIYLAGRFGARTENTLLIRQWGETEMGRFLCFEPLTLCPIDTRPIERSLLTDEEVQWLNDYHRMVCDKLLPLLAPDEQRWLKQATAAI
ncbi:MAG: aminopeptidase P family protein [Prevotella sp.]|nr:aminopeptidase P family protein [Prevotella sp.]